MPKLKTIYTCQNCSYTTSQWIGQCPSCHEWNTFIEDVQVSSPSKGVAGSKTAVSGKTQRLSQVMSAPPKRMQTGIHEFDRVLGGGFVTGQVILLGGEPGVGKSTLLTEISRSLKNKNILYICGEESVEQIKLRVVRMDYDGKNLIMLPNTDLDTVIATIESTKEDVSLIVIDSIQTMLSADIPGVAGSMTQVRGCTQALTNTVKSVGIPLVLIGHVTKEGVVAGPKVLEHIVDTVLYLEGDTQHMYRLLRTQKNRFGPVSEVGIFEITEKSMREVLNPSELFLSETLKRASGSCVTVVMEGQRPLLFEVQALTVKTSFGYPRRTTSGYNVNRLQVLLALIEKRCNINLSTYDVYLNVAGGFKIAEYASDLAVCLAIISSVKDNPLPPKTAAFGECGLSGEVRRVAHQEKRIKEAKKMGYTNVVSSETADTLKKALKFID
jgi:DNA repair protein RadA/Sms